MKRWNAIAVAAAVLVATAVRAETPEREIRSATAFLSAELRAEQEDETLNRGMLWVDQGAKLWSEPPGAAGRSCSSCHGAASTMRGVAARYPAVDATLGHPVTLDMRINLCRERHQGAGRLDPEAETLISLTALVASQSRGVAVDVDTGGAARAYLDEGRALWTTRQGQLDLACSQCHRDNVGRKLRADTISSGLGTAFPAYRLTWQGLGSLHRRLTACQQGVRATPIAYGSRAHIALELFLAWRARGLPLEAPGIRR